MRSTCDKENGQIMFRAVNYLVPGKEYGWNESRPSRLVRAIGCCYSPVAHPMKRRLQSLPRRWGRFPI